MTHPSFPPGPALTKSSGRLASCLVLVLAVAVYFPLLRHCPLMDPDEGRYAEIAREMVTSGDYIVPRLNYVAYLEKPPLFYWLTAASLRVFGQTETAVRLVPSVVGFLTVLLILMLGKQLWTARAGATAAWVYLTAVLPLTMARFPVIDGLFSLTLTATWAAGWLGYRAATDRGRRGWLLAAWTCLALATLTKGMAAIALTGGIVFLVLLLRRDLPAWRRLGWWPGLPVFLVLALPWHLAVQLRFPQFAHFYIVEQHFGRLAGAEHVKPFWFFAAIFPFALLPWSAFLPPAAVEAGRCVRAALRIGRKPSPEPGAGRVHPPGEDDVILFLVIWVLVVVGLFSVSNCKLIPYILPACPAAALLLGWYLDRKMESGSVLRWCAAVTALLLVAVIPVVARLARTDDTLPAEQMAALVRMIQGALLLGGGGLILALFRVRLIPAAAGFVLLLTLGPLMAGVISATRHFKIGALLEGLPDPLPPEIVVAEWKSYDRSLSFYLQRRVVLIDAVGELAFGQSLEESARFFRTGCESVRELTREGPLLINLRPPDWAECREAGCLKLVAANNKNLLAGNDAFFRLTQLQPWPDEALVRPPRLLLPRKQP